MKPIRDSKQDSVQIIPRLTQDHCPRTRACWTPYAPTTTVEPPSQATWQAPVAPISPTVAAPSPSETLDIPENEDDDEEIELPELQGRG